MASVRRDVVPGEAGQPAEEVVFGKRFSVCCGGARKAPAAPEEGKGICKQKSKNPRSAFSLGCFPPAPSSASAIPSNE